MKARTEKITLDLATIQRQGAGLSACSFGSYMAAMVHQWVHGSLPADLGEVVEIMRIRDVDPSRTALALLKRFFVMRPDGSWVSESTQAVRTATRSLSRTYQARSMKANQARWAGHVAKRPTKNPAYVSPSRSASSTPVSTACNNPPLPSQAQGNSPLALVPAARSQRREASASLRPVGRKAAKRGTPGKRPVEAPADPQTALPLQAGPASPPRAVAGHATNAQHVTPNAVFTPQDERFDEVANEIRNRFWAGCNGTSLPCPWGKGKGELSKLLSQLPGYPVEEFRKMLRNRSKSIAAGEFSPSLPPEDWIKDLPRFWFCPLNRFMSPLQVDERRFM